VLGFLPWTDPERREAVRENPAALAAEQCARLLAGDGHITKFIAVGVTADGVTRAMESVRLFEPDVVVAAGQTRTEPRVERFGRVPGAWSPLKRHEESPWLLAADAEELVAAVNALNDPAAATAPFRSSDDAGGYFCDHLCVELVRETRRRPMHARFLHITAIDDCTPVVREARLAMYARQMRAVAEILAKQAGAAAPVRSARLA
jgi:pyrrolidone-carboxylate peptidase